MQKILSEKEKLKLLNTLDQYKLVKKIVKKIAENNGRALLVGGAVRDLLLGLEIKDLDIEIHNLSTDKVEEILSSFGQVSLIGKIFGVFRVHGLEVDWSLPRADTSGRKPEVKIDPNMSIKQAFSRRDLTINSMGIDLITFELVDPFDGYQDLKNKILRATDPEFFTQDPLRFYRVMQFIGRFNMNPDNELNNICKTMDIKNISIERIDQEFRKLFLKSKKPSLGINWLGQINRLEQVLPELNHTINTPQEPDWHPEGDVYEHTMQALDASANINYENDHEKLIIMWSALCHDLGKVTKTEKKDGKIISYGHEIDSEKLARKLLNHITRDYDLIDSVCRLVRYHMQPGQLVIHNSTPAAYKRLANKLAPYANTQMLAKLMLADNLGRNPKKGEPLTGESEIVKKFLQKIEELKIAKSPEEPILHGRDLLDIIPPGPDLGRILKAAYEIQIDENIKDKQVLRERALELYNKKN